MDRMMTVRRQALVVTQRLLHIRCMMYDASEAYRFSDPVLGGA